MDAATTSITPELKVQVVPLEALAHETQGPTRGYAHIGFADYPEDAPGRLNFEPLMLFADGLMHPGEGFPMHRHEGIENICLVRSGCCRHDDTLGGHAVLRSGDACVMSTGRGLEHSEFVEGDESVRALVIWLRSDALDAHPTVQVGRASPHPPNRLWVVASGRPGRPQDALSLRLDAALLSARLDRGGSVEHEVRPGRRAYLLVLDAAATVNEKSLGAGERAFIEGTGTLVVQAQDPAQIYLVDMQARAP